MPQPLGILGAPLFSNEQSILSPAFMNPMLARQAETLKERKFQSEIRATPWFKEFVQQYGEEPDLSPNADYDYRKAWAAGIRPQQDPYDNNRYHWASSLPGGELLKSANHKTLWKEMFMRQTGKNPDAIGATEQDWLRMQGK